MIYTKSLSLNVTQQDGDKHQDYPYHDMRILHATTRLSDLITATIIAVAFVLLSIFLVTLLDALTSSFLLIFAVLPLVFPSFALMSISQSQLTLCR